MKLHFLSDLHIELSQYRPHSKSKEADVIVLVGDIWIGTKGIYWAREQWPQKNVLYVAGNHEYYRSNRPQTLIDLRRAAEDCEVHFLDNDATVIELNGERVRFIGCTLWTDFNLFGAAQRQFAMIAAQNCMNDFRLIREGDWNFSAQDAINLHIESVKWLETTLEEAFEGPTVVVTHHAPSWKSVVPKFQHDLVSAAFASDLSRLMGRAQLWLHGHMHDSFDYEIEGTRVLCNPRGYTRYEGGEENSYFNPALLINVCKSGVAIDEDLKSESKDE